MDDVGRVSRFLPWGGTNISITFFQWRTGKYSTHIHIYMFSNKCKTSILNADMRPKTHLNRPEMNVQKISRNVEVIQIDMFEVRTEIPVSVIWLWLFSTERKMTYGKWKLSALKCHLSMHDFEYYHGQTEYAQSLSMALVRMGNQYPRIYTCDIGYHFVFHAPSDNKEIHGDILKTTVCCISINIIRRVLSYRNPHISNTRKEIAYGKPRKQTYIMTFFARWLMRNAEWIILLHRCYMTCRRIIPFWNFLDILVHNYCWNNSFVFKCNHANNVTVYGLQASRLHSHHLMMISRLGHG